MRMRDSQATASNAVQGAGKRQCVLLAVSGYCPSPFPGNSGMSVGRKEWRKRDCYTLNFGLLLVW